jgi:hypothetical protein
MSRPIEFSSLVALLLVICFSFQASAGQPFFLSGTIRGGAGEPVVDAEVYFYTSTNIRRPADFISPKTDQLGKFRLEVPAGIYWAVARERKGERFGPLALGYRHSGEPVMVIVGDEPETVLDFTIADLRELAQLKPKSSSELITVSGRIVDVAGNGQPLAYAFARSDNVQVSMPEYFSMWTDNDGRFTLQLPPGNYDIGAAHEFPPRVKPGLTRNLKVEAGKLPVAIDLTLLIY